MKASITQNQKYKSINELKDELLKSMRVSQQQKPKGSIGVLNNSAFGSKYNNPLKSTSPDKTNIQPSQKKNSSSQQNNKAIYNTNSNKKSIDSEPEPEVDVTTSTIDELLEQIEEADKGMEEFKQKFNEKFNETLLENLPDEQNELKNNAKNVVSQLFKLQEEYYKGFNQEMVVNNKLKQLLVLYNQKFRGQLKKSNKIKENFETNNIQNTLTLTINREENTRFKDMVNSNKIELNIFKKILKINYNENDLNTFKEENKLTNEAEEKRLLIKTFEKLISGNNQILSKLPDNKKLAIQTICTKYYISLPEQDIEEKSKEEQLVNNQEKEVVNTQENVVNNQENEEKNESEEKKENSEKPADSLDAELREFLIQYYLKKKISQVPFIRLGPGHYEYGTQKIYIKKDNDSLKVKVGNSYVLLERFIELNANSEEFKLMKYSKKSSLTDSKRASTIAQRGSSTKTQIK